MIQKYCSSQTPDVQAVKSAASGRELEILRHVGGIDAELLDGRHHPCPKCGGHDRFSLIDAKAGAVLCRHCFYENNGDVIAAVQWIRDCTFPETLLLIAEYLGMNPVGGNRVAIPAKVVRPVVKAANVGSVPKTNVKPKLLRIIKYEYLNGVGDYHVLVKRCEYDNGEKPSIPYRWDIEQRRYIKGIKGHNVVAVPYDAPSFKEASTIFWTEGEKAAAYLAHVMRDCKPKICCSCNWGGANNFPRELVAWFHGKDVIVFADNDEAGAGYANRVATAITGIAKSVKIVSFPNFTTGFDIADWVLLDESEATA